MKTYFAFLIVLIFISCNKDNSYCYSGRASFYLNGEKKEFNFCRGTIAVYDKNKFDLSFDLKKNGENNYETLLFNNILKTDAKQGLLNIIGPENYAKYYKGIGSDLLCEVYDVLLKDSLTNFINVNTNKLPIINGGFSATFVIKDPINKCYPNSADTLRITNGTFETKIFK